MQTVAFTQKGFEEYNEWFETNKQIIDRIKILIRDINRNHLKDWVSLNRLKATGAAIGAAALIVNTGWCIK